MLKRVKARLLFAGAKYFLVLFMLTLGVVIGLLGGTVTADTDDATETTEVKIGTKDQLLAFAESVKSNNTLNAKLTADIDLGVPTEANTGNWTPIGQTSETGATTVSISYQGTFDGNGHVIKNLYIWEGGKRKGFFSQIENATIKNLGIENGVVRSNDEQIGAIVGLAVKSTIINCFNGADVFVDSDSETTAFGVGGIAGKGEGSIFENCYNYGTIGNPARPTATQGNAGIVYFTVAKDGNVVVKNCYNFGRIYGVNGEQTFAVARNTNITMTNSYFSNEYGIGNAGLSGSIGKPPIAFKNGEVAYLLRDAYGQTLTGENKDALPVFRTASNQVHQEVLAYGKHYYSNDNVPLFQRGIEVGKGTESEPYLIGSYLQLLCFSARVVTTPSSCAKLTADIDLENDNWIPIGKTAANASIEYTGIFDGGGHVIKNLYIWEDNNANDFGFFSKTNGATIRNLGIKSGVVRIVGMRAGGIVGTATKSTIINCFNGADVFVDNTNENNAFGVGGIAGKGDSSTFENCYNYGTIGNPAKPTAKQGNAGIVYFTNNDAEQSRLVEVKNCYNFGKIYGVDGSANFTFAIARNTNITMTNSYFTNEYEIGNAGLAGAIEKPHSAFKNGEVAYLLRDAYGQILTGDSPDLLPVFLTKYNRVHIDGGGNYSNNFSFLTGDGTSSQPYEINTVDQLLGFAQKVNLGDKTVCAKLMSDIDLSSTSWTTIDEYSGTFDGNGHVIKNLNIVDSGDHVGFFKKIDNATIKHLGIDSGSITGHNSLLIGSFAGYAANNSSLSDCFNLAKVEAKGSTEAKVGGIMGSSTDSTLTNCFSSATLTGTNTFPLSEAGTAENSYYLSNSSAGIGTAKTTTDFSSGKVAYLLGSLFGQTIETDTTPVFVTANNIVYESHDESKYFNTLETIIEFDQTTNKGLLTSPVDINNATLFLARYGTNDALLDVDMVKITDYTASSRKQRAFGFQISPASGGNYKLMLWENQTIRPLTLADPR